MTWPMDVFEKALMDCEFISAHASGEGAILRKIDNDEKLKQSLAREGEKRRGFPAWWIL